MATDNSEPRIGRIVFVGVFVVAALLCVRAGLVAYFDIVSHAEELRKNQRRAAGGTTRIQAEESLQLCSGRLPMDHAMKELAARGALASVSTSSLKARETRLHSWAGCRCRRPHRCGWRRSSTHRPSRLGTGEFSLTARGTTIPPLLARRRRTESRPSTLREPCLERSRHTKLHCGRHTDDVHSRVCTGISSASLAGFDRRTRRTRLLRS